jgi:phosphatidylserine decarboxylase
MLLLLLFSLIISSCLYLYLHKKTRVNLKYLFIDNIIVGLLAFIISYYILGTSEISFILCFLLIPVFAFSLTMLRFWRTPRRKGSDSKSDIVSPADGNIIYIKKFEANQLPVSIKNKSVSKLEELIKTDLLNTPCWLIGINMTPFDVHKNCSPIDGTIILKKHFEGKFLSLKNPDSVIENERCTYVIKNADIQVGVIQIASKRVRRIDSYVKVDQQVMKGEWLGMIRFGSQVDLILPVNININVIEKQQVYAGSSTIGKLD